MNGQEGKAKLFTNPGCLAVAKTDTSSVVPASSRVGGRSARSRFRAEGGAGDGGQGFKFENRNLGLS